MSLRSRMKVLAEKWFNTTSFQGPGELSQEPGKVWRIYWTLVTIVMIICLLLILYPLMTSYYNGQYSTTTTKQAVVTDSKWVKEFEKFLYCTDNWINMTKVIERKIKEKMLLFALSLIQPDKGEIETIGALGQLLYRHLQTNRAGEIYTLNSPGRFEQSRINSPLRNKLIVGETVKPRNLAEFQQMLTTGNYYDLDQLLFSIANRFDLDDSIDTMTTQWPGVRLLHDGFLIRHGRVCQRLSLKEYIDDYISAQEQGATSLDDYGPTFRFCLLHNRTNYLLGTGQSLSFEGDKQWDAVRKLSFFTGVIDGVDELDFPADDKVTTQPLSTIIEAGVMTEYTISLSKSTVIDKRDAPCTLDYYGTNFPAFADFKSYCDRICMNMAASETPVCSGTNCQNCTFFYSESATLFGKLPCQTYIDSKPTARQFRTRISEYNSCKKKCIKPCNTVSFNVKKRGVPSPLPSYRCGDENYELIYNPTDEKWRKFVECEGYFEDIISLKITANYDLNEEVALHSLEGLFGQMGGNLGLFLGASWFSFFHLIASICCCRFNWNDLGFGRERLK